jgi:hypothetical protein
VFKSKNGLTPKRFRDIHKKLLPQKSWLLPFSRNWQFYFCRIKSLVLWRKLFFCQQSLLRHFLPVKKKITK